MQSTPSGSLGSPPAITDLYDEDHNRLLVQYPPLLIITLGLTGVGVFALTGFLGYSAATPNADGVYPFANGLEWLFREPWALFFWFCALMITLQASIFRHPSLRRQRNQTLVVSALSIAIVILAYYFRSQLQGAADGVSQYVSDNWHLRIEQGLLFALFNYGILTIFWVDSVRRWTRRARGLSITPQFDLGRPGRKRVTLVPSLSELVSGDLIAGAALSALLWLIFSPSTMGAIADLLGARTLGANGQPIDPTCSGNCSIVDRNQTLIYLFLGLLILALTAMVNGLEALSGVNRSVVTTVSSEVETGTEKGTKGVVQTLFETLLSAISRQGINILSNLTLALRLAAWPFLVLLGTAGLSVAARYIQLYLHATSCARGTSAVLACDAYSAQHHAALDIALNGVYGFAGGAVALVSIVLSATLLLYQWRIAQNTFNFIRLLGLIILLTFWIFSLSLSALNAILSPLVTDVTSRWPFAQPGVTTIVSFASLVGYGALLFIQRSRRGDQSPLFLPEIGRRSRPKATPILATTATTFATPATTQHLTPVSPTPQADVGQDDAPAILSIERKSRPDQ